MKLAIILPGGVDRSGVDRVIPSRLWLIERLARRHEVHVFAMRQEPLPATWELLGAQVHNIGTASGSTRRLLARFGELHRDGGAFDVAHAFFGWCGTSTAAIGWRYGVPVLFHPSGGEFVSMPSAEYGMRSSWRGRIGARVAVAGAARLTVASRPMQELAARQGATAERVAIGVALDRWPVREPQARDTTQPIRLLHVGDIRPVKDQTMLIDAVRRMREAGCALTLDMAGLDMMDGFVQQSSSARAIAGITRWHGVLGRDALRALVEQSDILLVSSRHEAGPLVVLEAAVAGVPTVGTAVGHIAEWAPEGAVSVPVGDAAALADATMALASDEPRRLSLAYEAQRRAVAIDADYTAGAFERIYLELAGTR